MYLSKKISLISKTIYFKMENFAFLLFYDIKIYLHSTKKAFLRYFTIYKPLKNNQLGRIKKQYNTVILNTSFQSGIIKKH